MGYENEKPRIDIKNQLGTLCHHIGMLLFLISEPLEKEELQDFKSQLSKAKSIIKILESIKINKETEVIIAEARDALDQIGLDNKINLELKNKIKEINRKLSITYNS
ncbi:MAG: hypothetical protein A2271_00080 [Candidatus Moranbacteria bacterium RIFOXYA12_FULL_35_19]|nr:MAG: hypothetical protein UR78_C0023G0011 [Candidatus Moranbacteria bacterium GW2011_GWF2_35_39]OGI32371.1 MAG: hypothetical protein A2489_01570 [Candidatus Moranbacteria bacterium RIFOXYC12_FULL_36_13]OGI33254.1 MAG: hypothetical protein A2343_03185 [Candidatus Moranbacteria bacterium RIFOXYB12_FULL_35_8]OGI35348.1 MAG: hypothetical protein A2271_00080 [Candidatus Moranbacteria bacterium RIFOXYA12_FULL_35_19]